MGHPIWPLFDLRVRTPRLELRYIDDELSTQLAELALDGVHPPDFMPFTVPWTATPPPRQQREAMQWYWRGRAGLSATSWHLPFAVLVDGGIAGVTELKATQFPILRTFGTGSWLGLRFQGRGIGKEMRAASLHLGFAGLDAVEATTGAYVDNGASRGVTTSLGYTSLGTVREVRLGAAAVQEHFHLPRADWERIRRDDIEIAGLEPCLDLLGLAPSG
ncbi:MAG: GNAT family protein [Ilumatobacteraceae bacterium]